MTSPEALKALLDGVFPLEPEQLAPIHDETILLSRLVADLRELALAEAGRSDVVYRIINRADAPGYGCMLQQHGLKTLSERWDRPGSSLNHCMFGHIQEWFGKYLLGIRQTPGSTGWYQGTADAVRQQAERHLQHRLG